jgi:hypothetical protein
VGIERESSDFNLSFGLPTSNRRGNSPCFNRSVILDRDFVFAERLHGLPPLLGLYIEFDIQIINGVHRRKKPWRPVSMMLHGESKERWSVSWISP